MAFTKGTPRTPTSIGLITVTLSTTLEGSKAALYDLEVLDQDGHKMPYDGDHGDLVPYLTQAQITALIGFMDDLRAQAVAQIIG